MNATPHSETVQMMYTSHILISKDLKSASTKSSKCLLRWTHVAPKYVYRQCGFIVANDSAELTLEASINAY